MTRVAALDCGTNALRLLVSDLEAGPYGSPVKTDLHREMRVVRLGEGVDRTGLLAAPALRRTADALADYRRTCEALDVQVTRLVATSAARDAGNREAFTDLVREVLGVCPEVVTGAEEARLSFAGATTGLPAEQAPYLVVDVGGGSTEFVLGAQAVEAAASVDVGCVRLTERHLHDDPPTAAQVQAARADVQVALARVREVVPVQRARTPVGLAGTVTTIAALALGLARYDADRIHLSRVTADQVREVTARLLAMSTPQRAALGPVHPGRADVLAAGAVVLQTTVDVLRWDTLLVSEADILDGIVWTTGADPPAGAVQTACAPTDTGTTDRGGAT